MRMINVTIVKQVARPVRDACGQDNRQAADNVSFMIISAHAIGTPEIVKNW
jgi:hypothetical protein